MQEILSDDKREARQPVPSDNVDKESASSAMLDLPRRLGEVINLMLFSHSHEHLFLSDLKWSVLPPLKLGQYRLVQDKRKRVVAYVSWAWVSEAVESRLSSGKIKLRPSEWKCGDQAVIMDMLSMVGGETAEQKILEELKEKVFSGGLLKVFRWDKEKQHLVLREV